MRVIDHINAATGPSFSAEIIPPPRGRSVRDLIEVVECLGPVRPRWIDVTSHSSTANIHEDAKGNLRRKIFKKRPGTIGICGVIQNRFKIDTVAHVLCQGFTREETEDALIELNFLGVENILALRGDGSNYDKPVDKHRSVNTYACDLVKQVKDLRDGQYLEDISNSVALDFCVGVAGYPEKHFEAANMKTDLMYLKKKVDAGAEYIITQMFFNNDRFFSFVKECREIGIKVPIIPGIKVLRSLSQLRSIPRTFHIDLPDALVDEVMETPEHVQTIGRRWAENQVKALLDKGFNNIHFYVMQDANMVSQIVQTVS
ncbi:MAG: methylenetetrahydrofolate reductase [Bdellovibrionales bacterium]|nr:methylenetetrahydrofolate reductase [Bdellovibrionales bacterium]